MTAIDRSPARTSAGITLLAGGIAIAILSAPVGAIIGGVGLAFLFLGVVKGWRRAITIGAFVIFLGVIYAGLQDVPPEELLLAGTSTVIAWDVGEQSVNVGEQLGRKASTARGELVHAASSTVVGVVTVGLGYLIYRLATGGQPLTALAILLTAVIALVAAVRD